MIGCLAELSSVKGPSARRSVPGSTACSTIRFNVSALDFELAEQRWTYALRAAHLRALGGLACWRLSGPCWRPAIIGLSPAYWQISGAAAMATAEGLAQRLRLGRPSWAFRFSANRSNSTRNQLQCFTYQQRLGVHRLLELVTAVISSSLSSLTRARPISFLYLQKMVLKTNTCRFSGLRIYPGKGMIFIRTDGQHYMFLNKKCKSYYHNRLRPAKLAWTVTYRKQHKKDQVGRQQLGGKGAPWAWGGQTRRGRVLCCCITKRLERSIVSQRHLRKHSTVADSARGAAAADGAASS